MGFFYSWGKAGDTEVWTTIDGGQGTKGVWEKGVYKEGSGKQEIKRRDRKFWPDGTIEGEPGQGADAEGAWLGERREARAPGRQAEMSLRYHARSAERGPLWSRAVDHP